MATWTSIARELCEYLQTTEDKFSLLQRIDSAILDTKASVDDVLRLALEHAQSLLRLPRASAYIFAGGQLEKLASTDFQAPTRITEPSVISSSGHTLISRQTHAPTIADQLSCETVLVVPIHGPGGALLGYLCFESNHPAAVGHLATAENVEFAAAIAKQLSIAIEFKEEMRADAVRWSIVEEILANDLKPSSGFNIVCSNVHNFLPTYEAFRIEPPPACQLLLHKATDEYLTVVATTGTEPLNTRVLIERSVCGQLIHNHQDMLSVDPRRDPAYRAYLGEDMKSELALRWPVAPDTTIIINLESSVESVFTEVHVDALRRARRYLQPILSGLHSRRDRTRLQQRALLYSLDNHLAIVTSIFAHDMATPLSRVRFIEDGLDTVQRELPTQVTTFAASLRSAVADMEGVRTSLARDIVGFAHNEARSVGNLLRSARLLSHPDELAKENRNIEIVIDCADDIYVYCSLFLKEIFVNLFANAKYWIEQRQLEDPSHRGTILARVHTTTPDPAHREAELNQKVIIVVRDNGPGMDTAHLVDVFERSFTLRAGGTGFGLFAAKEYINSLGGMIAVASEPGEFFEVTITLDIYDQRLYPESEAPAVLELHD